MGRIFITGSGDGLGLLAAKSLISKGHEVVLHARNEVRKQETLEKVKGKASVLTGDLSVIEEIKALAAQVNSLAPFDAIIHNAGVYQVSQDVIFTVNTLAPYLLTCLIKKPQRIIYLSSGMHLQGKVNPENFAAKQISYSDSKLHVLMLAKALASRWPEVYANAVDPGWVPTRMGGQSAPDDLQKGYETQVWLAVSNDEKAKVSGRYFYHQKEKRYNTLADDVSLQEKFLQQCKDITGIAFN